MIAIDPHLAVRAASLYVAVMLTLLVWAVRRPHAREMSSAVLASLWNLPVLLVLNVAAVRFGLWRFDAEGGLLLGIPVDLLLAWAWLWGAVPALAFPRVPLAAVAGLALGVDLILMRHMSPVLHLGSGWLVGEAIGLLCGVVPGLLLARWTLRDEHLSARAALQVLAFGGLAVFVLPAIIIQAVGGNVADVLTRPTWQLSVIAQLLAVPAFIGLSAVHEFATRGGGTPVPFDPPKRLVTSGLYAYVRNPMQLSAVALFFLLGLALRNYWISAAGVMAHIYSIGLAGWDEDADLHQRFGTKWQLYRRGVRAWFPRVRPWHDPDEPAARLYVAASCSMCSEVGDWFRHRRASHLDIVAAETHPSRRLTRITYESGDGSSSASGVHALARALEHVHFGWAIVGCVLRLPGIGHAVQLLVDASGGEPRPAEIQVPRGSKKPHATRWQQH